MTTQQSSFLNTCLTGAGSGFVRGLIGTPLDAFTTEAIVSDKKTFETMRSIWEKGYLYRGFWAYTGRQTLRIPISLISANAGSRVYKITAPESTPPVLRGIVVGSFVGFVETVVVLNPLRSIQTQLLTGLSWKEISSQGIAGLKRGLDAALFHRASSWALFLGTYETLHDYPTVVASTVAGTVQVAVSSPFFQAMIHKQKAGHTQASLMITISNLCQKKGVRALFLPGLQFRLAHSWCVSYIAMEVIKQLGVIQR